MNLLTRLTEGRPTIGIATQGFWRNAVLMLACLGLLLTVDRPMMEMVKQTQEPHLFLFMKWATTIGYGGVDLLIATGVVFAGYWRRDRHAAQAGKLALLAVLASAVASLILKHLACRSRPYMPDAGTFHFFPCASAGLASFPSGHVSTIVALAAVLAVAYPTWKAPIIGTAVLVAFSRIYLGLHFPSDVLAAAFLAFTISRPFVATLNHLGVSTRLLGDVP